LKKYLQCAADKLWQFDAEIILSAEKINEIDEKLNQMQFLVFGGNQAK